MYSSNSAHTTCMILPYPFRSLSISSFPPLIMPPPGPSAQPYSFADPYFLHSCSFPYLWWSILHVNLHEPRCPHMWPNIILVVSATLLLEEINIRIGELWIKQITFLILVALIQSVENLNRTKRMTFPLVRDNFIRQPLDLNYDIGSSLGLYTADPLCRF